MRVVWEFERDEERDERRKPDTVADVVTVSNRTSFSASRLDPSLLSSPSSMSVHSSSWSAWTAPGNLFVCVAGCKVERPHTTSCKGSNNGARLKNLVTDPFEHAAKFSFIDIDIVLLILKHKFPVLSLHLAKDDHREPGIDV